MILIDRFSVSDCSRALVQAPQRQHEGHGGYGGGYETVSTHTYMAASTTRLGAALAGAQVFGREGGFMRDKVSEHCMTLLCRISGTARCPSCRAYLSI